MAHPAPTLRLRLAVWNLHRGRGRDGRIDPARTLSAIISTPEIAGADILSLHEAEAEAPPYGGFLDLGALEAATGLRSAHDAPGLRFGPDSHGFLGNLLLLRPPLAAQGARILRMTGLYPRAAVVVALPWLRLAATHLSLSQPLRIVQMRAVGRALAALPPAPAVVMGDLNEWRPWGGLALSAAATGLRLSGSAPPTFPAGRPLLALDRILAEAPARLSEVCALRSTALAAASDHLPLVATLELPLSSGTATSG